MNKLTLTLPFLCLLFSLHAFPPSPAKLKALYNSLDATSFSQHLAFYELYPNTPEGNKALQITYDLLTGGTNASTQTSQSSSLLLPQTLPLSINSLVGLVNKHPSDKAIQLSDAELNTIETLAQHLPNRRLLGHAAQSEEEVLNLLPHQIDIARGILLSQLGNSSETIRTIRSYEAVIDLMALQILTRISLHSPPKKKIRAINHYIFEEMGFRFPPHSTYAKDIDLYTFLPSVLDSRRGVCLGVSILYLCLAQRLNLDLEIVTPPGHIFVRWKKGDKTINIETTARGINVPDDTYLGVDTRSLQKRDIKETIGLAHQNQASTFLEREEYQKALASYQKARKYLLNDKHLQMLMGYTAILAGDEVQGKLHLEEIKDYLPDDAVSKDTTIEDYLNGHVDAEGIAAVFMKVDETRESLLEKKQQLETILKKYPKFRDGIFSLAGTWLQLHRSGEALDTLQSYHSIDPNNATVEYYLAALYAERIDYNKAWHHLRQAERLALARKHDPQALLLLRQALQERCPE